MCISVTQLCKLCLLHSHVDKTNVCMILVLYVYLHTSALFLVNKFGKMFKDVISSKQQDNVPKGQ